MQASIVVTTVLLLVAVAFAQDYDYESGPQTPLRPAPPRINPGYSGVAKPTPAPPVAILKQINRHNEDGSYTYGYESGDGSFKIETKLPNGEVKGKYGYPDETGKLRVIEYGANQYGFQPAGEGITVAPPTLVDETTNKDGTLNPEFADQYAFEPQPAQRPAARPAPIYRPAPIPQARPLPVEQSYVQEFAAPQRYSPAPLPQRSASPVPARAVISGALPSGGVPVHTFVPAPRPAPQRIIPQPAPVAEDIQYAGPPRSAPQLQFALPRPAPQPSFRPAPIPQYTGPRTQAAPSRAGGILDQLAKDYALPADSPAALHDISFGYY